MCQRDNKWMYWFIYISCLMMVFLPSEYGFTDWQYYITLLGVTGIYWIGLQDGKGGDTDA